MPHPFTANDRAAGYRYDLSILQAEFARTQVFDRPLSGRHLFEEIIRENLDLGRPEQVSLIFERRITKRTPGRFATRVITQGVTPSLNISYKSTKVNARVIRPGLSQLHDGCCPKAPNRPLANAIRQLDQACEQLFAEAKLAA